MLEKTPSKQPGKFTFAEVYAPRAALYEALPGFLLRLNGGGPTGKRLASPDSPVWARLTGSRGSHEPERSTVGQEYDFGRFEAEAGLDVAVGEHFTGSISLRHVTGAVRAEVSVDDFTDKVAARVSIADVTRFTGGAGVIVETERAFEGGALSLRGSLDLAQTLEGAETAADVSGERLESKSAKTRILLGLGGVYRTGRFSISGEVSMGGLGSDDTQYSGQVTFGLRF